ncbi:MAG: hypothetical protein H7Y42_11905 [Chitinophagaceae bacterium]|nr:hypothetical protein [Chitinophagaceae bacterium]
MQVKREYTGLLVCFLAVAFILHSCASYNRQAADYYSNLKEGNYEEAGKALDNNKLLGKNRNQLLFLLERGKICHLLQQYDSSNNYFNDADRMMEDARTSAKDIVFGSLINPMMQSYKGEDFEKYLIHYYKTLNYLQLGKPAEALVESRRITLRTYTQEDKLGDKQRYSEDAFSYILQGMIYETDGDMNNAFIAYRNAVDLYLKHKGEYYGTVMPEQLKGDLLRTASLNGFVDELTRYEHLLDTVYSAVEPSAGGELVLFWENGSAPVKYQQDIHFSLIKNDENRYFFSGNGMQVPFDPSAGYDQNQLKLENLRSLRIAVPVYRSMPMIFTCAQAELNGRQFPMERAEDINTLAIFTLRERAVKELSSTLTRLAIKKMTEAAVRPEKKDDKDDDKNDKGKKGRIALAFGLQVFNFASEKADTRNWQSLPHTIYYTRIPLAKGQNEVELRFDGDVSKTLRLSVPGKGGLQFRNICTL